MDDEKLAMTVSLSRMTDKLYLLHLDGGAEDERHLFVVDEDSLWDLHVAIEHFQHRVMDDDMPLNGPAEVVDGNCRGLNDA